MTFPTYVWICWDESNDMEIGVNPLPEPYVFASEAAARARIADYKRDQHVREPGEDGSIQYRGGLLYWDRVLVARFAPVSEVTR